MGINLRTSKEVSCSEVVAESMQIYLLEEASSLSTLKSGDSPALCDIFECLTPMFIQGLAPSLGRALADELPVGFPLGYFMMSGKAQHSSIFLTLVFCLLWMVSSSGQRWSLLEGKQSGTQTLMVPLLITGPCSSSIAAAVVSGLWERWCTCEKIGAQMGVLLFIRTIAKDKHKIAENVTKA